MGGHSYQYVIEYQDDAAAALAQLRREVFARGDYYGADRHPRTPEEAVELSGETGTRSILDISRIAKRPDSCCAAVLTPAEVERYFGTATPTVAMVEQCDQLWADLERGMARYLVTFDHGVPRHLVFVGYSFD